MPKYFKDTKLEVWRDGEAHQDGGGSWHRGEPYLAGTVWGNLKGEDFSETYAMSARWAKPVFKVTVTRPTWDIELGDHIRYKGRFYEVMTVDELTGKTGRDIKLTCQFDSFFKPKL